MTASRPATAAAARVWWSRHWFSLALVALLALAWAWPRPEEFIRRHHLLDVLIALVFLSSGLTIRFRQLLAGLIDAPSFLIIQFGSFALFPLLMLGVMALAFPGADESLRLGLVILLAVPTTITSCVILTTLAGGATGVALVSAVAGNLLGVVISPALIALLAGVRAEIDAGEMMLQLVRIVLAPALAGQLIRRANPEFFSRQARRFSLFNQCSVLTIVYASAARAIPRLAAAPTLLPRLVVTLAAFHALMLGAMWLAARARTRHGGERAQSLQPAIVFCGAQKTMAIGQALASSLALQTGLNAGVLMAPMVVYHIAQLLADSWLAQRWGRRPPGGPGGG